MKDGFGRADGAALFADGRAGGARRVIEDAPMEARRKTSYLPMHRVVVEETG